MPASLVMAAVALPGSAQADPTIIYSVDAGLGAGYSTSPLLARDDGGAGFLELNITPRLTISDERNTTAASGRFRRTRYLSDYGSTYQLGLDLSHAARLTERLSVGANAGFDRSVQGERDAYLDPVEGPSPPDGIPGDTPLPPDVLLTGTRQPRTMYRVGGNMSYLVSELDSLSLVGLVSRTHYSEDTTFSSFRTISGSVQYSRSLSATARAGGLLSVQHIDYAGVRGQYDIYKPQATYSGQLNARWTIDAGVGLLHARGSGGGGFSTTGISADIELCSRGEWSSTCFNFTRDATPSGLGGVRSRLAGSARYTQRLGEHSSFSISGSYTRYSSDLSDDVTGVNGSGTLASLDGSVRTQVSRRLFLNGSAGVRRTSYPGAGASTDARVQGGVSYRFGNRP